MVLNWTLSAQHSPCILGRGGKDRQEGYQVATEACWKEIDLSLLFFPLPCICCWDFSRDLAWLMSYPGCYGERRHALFFSLLRLVLACNVLLSSLSTKVWPMRSLCGPFTSRLNLNFRPVLVNLR